MQLIFIGKWRHFRLDYLSAQQSIAVKDAQRGEADSLTALLGCAAQLSQNYGGHTKMKTDNFCKENRPEAKKKLRLPDQLELVMEDGTVYRVRSFFAAEQQMGDVLDALSLEKVNREN